MEVEGLGHGRCGGVRGIGTGTGGGTGESSTGADAADPAAVDAVLIHLIAAATAAMAAAAAASVAVRRRSDRQRRRQQRFVPRRQGIHDGHCHLLDSRQDVRRRVQRRAGTVLFRRGGGGHTRTGGGGGRGHGSHGSAAGVKNKNVIGIPAALSPVVGGWTDAAAAAAAAAVHVH